MLKKKKETTGDVSLYSDLISLIEELCCVEKHAQNNIKHNEENKERAEKWVVIADDLRKLRFKWQGLLDNKKYSYEELHCTTKHLLTASKNFLEVGNKLFDVNKEYSREAFTDRIKMLDIVIDMNELNTGGG